MFPTVRQSLSWLHHWIGIGFGGLLFATFWFGSLAVFDSEIDRWMQPQTRIASVGQLPSFDAMTPSIKAAIGEAPNWAVKFPDARDGRLQVRAAGGMASKPVAADLDPRTGARIPKMATRGASGLFLPFHYSLLIAWGQLGYWIVAFATIAMLVTLISGVVIHVRLVPDLFTYRARASGRRRLLDLHSLMGSAALPFTAAMALSGLLVSYSNIMPAGIRVAYGGNRAQYFSEVFGNFKRPAAHRPAVMAPFDPMIAEAQRRWGGGRPALAQIFNAGDANAYVALHRRNDDRVTVDPQLIYFDGVTGRVLKFQPMRSGLATQRWLTGLHMVQFDRPALRWLYFALGLMGCVTIATGMLSWIEARRRNGKRSGTDMLAIGAITGPMLATLAYLLVNRLLPSASALHASMEISAFFSAWALAAVHTGVRIRMVRARSVWAEQCIAVAALSVLAAFANWTTTPDNPIHAIALGHTVVLGVDLMLLVTAVLAATAARQLVRSPKDAAV